jgi:phage tail sheath protein FI
MAAFERPDIYVTETLRTGVRSSALPTVPAGAFLGLAQKGPTNTPTRVDSWAEYRTIFGGFDAGVVDGLSPLHYAVHQFFVNGGSQCWITRVTDGTGVAALQTLEDRAGAPLDTLRVTAVSQGTWGNALNIGVFDRGATGSGRFDIVVYDGPAVDANIVERFTDLTLDASEVRYVESVINSETRGSKYITVENLASVTAAPNNVPAVGTFALTTGTSGAAPDAADFTSAIDGLDAVQEPMIVNVAGNTDNDVLSALLAFCEGRTDCFAVIDTSAGLTPENAITEVASLSPATSYGAAYWPHLVINDPAVARSGATKVVAPGGAVVGTIMRIDASDGPERTPAGALASLRGVNRLAGEATLDELGMLNVNNVNAIRQFPNTGLSIMGGRTLKASGPDRYINVRRSLIYVRRTLVDLLRFAQFENNDPILWATVTQEITRVLTGYWQGGGLKGSSAAEAFFVKCDGENNTASSIEEGELHVEVGVSLQFPAEFIVLRLGQFESGSVTVEEV